MPDTPVPYRILIGPLYNPGVLGGYFGRSEIKTFMSEPAPAGPYDLTYEIGRDSFADLLARLDGWEPDLVIWWDLIYQALPPGIADCPYPTAVIVGDWNLHFFAVEHYVSAFDYVFGDRQLMELLAAMGHKACQYWPGFSYEPAKHHPMPEQSVDYDISFVGNLNHLVQRQRAAYLERIARLGERWRVRIAGGVHGEAYTRLLAGSRIVFNHSIRGEMNMRAYEAPACGALLMMEAANLEVREFLEPGRECVLYQDENLEALIDHYLSHEDERAAIAAAGQAKIQAYSYERQFGMLLDLLPQVIAAFEGPGARGFHRLAPWQQTLVCVRQLYRANTPGANRAALAALIAAADFSQARQSRLEPALLNQMGKFLLELALDQRHYQQQHADAEDLAGPNLAEAERLLALAKARAPQEPIPAFNLAWCRELRGQPEQALADYAEALALLAASPVWNPWFDPVLPLGYHQRFGIEWDRRQAAAIAIADAGRMACVELLQWQIHDRRAHLLLQHDAAAAEAAWRAAASFCPEFGETEAFLGQALLAQNRQGEAIAAFEAAIASQPFMVGLWSLTARLQIAQGDFAAALALLTPRLPVLAVNEGLTRERPGIEELLNQARTGQALATGTPVAAEWLGAAFSIPRYRQLCDWAARYPVPAALTAPLTLVWQPGWPEPGCLFPPESGVAFAAAPSGLSLRIGASTQPPSPPLDYLRVYGRASDLAVGLIGPDQLPFLFPDLLPEAIELEDQRAFNFLLLSDRLDTAECLALVRAFASGFDDDQEAALLLWKPAGPPDEAELAALEAALGESQAQVALVPEGLSPNQQGLILQSMQLILGEPTQAIAWQLAWALRLGVPVRFLSEDQEHPAEPAFYQGFGLTELYLEPGLSPAHLLALRAQYAELSRAAQARADAIQKVYREGVAQQILDLCWSLRLRLWQAAETA